MIARDRAAWCGAEKRRGARAASRLRPAILLSGDGRFLADCVIRNRSEGGMRLGFFADPPANGEALLYDETAGTIVPVRLVWRGHRLAGARFTGRPVTLDRQRRERIAGRYYAVGG